MRPRHSSRRRPQSGSSWRERPISSPNELRHVHHAAWDQRVAPMITVHARCTCGPREHFKPTTIERRDVGPRDVLIDIAYAGICHSDIDHAYSVRGKTMYPLVPGHEIAGIVSAVGSEVTKFAVGDRAGVGNM